MSVARLSVRAWGAILAAYLLAVLVAAGSWSLPGLVDLERLAYDLRLALAAEPAPQDPRIVLVTFDEWSVAQTRRRSPLDRKTLAAALARLDRLGPRAIGVDVLFDQPGVPTDDDRLAQTLASLRTPVFVADDSAGAGELLKPWQRDSLHSFLERFGGAARRGASAALFADSDGVVRRTAPAGRRTLADAMAQTLGAPVRREERAIDYRRPSGADEVFARLPILTLATAPDATLALYAPLVRGRAVLVGAELDNEDRHRTPLSLQTGRTTSGLEIQAASLATLLDGPSPNAAFTPLFWLLALAPPALGVLVGLLRLPAWARVLIVLGTTTAVALAAWAWELQPGVQTYGLPIVGPAAAWLFTGLVAGAASAA
ncbi:MAG TPA: CHASE2 domain-containing protein, partial [Phenylobacterium sp.]